MWRLVYFYNQNHMLMKRILFFMLVLGAVVLNACQPEPFLSVSPESLSFPAEGGSQTIEISSNSAWTAVADSYDFSVSPSSGSNNGTVTVTIPEATTLDPFSGSVLIKSGGLSAVVNVTREPKPTILLGDDITIPANGGTFQIDIHYNAPFTVEVEESARSWITFVQTRSLKSGKLEFSFAANENTEPRTGRVTVKGSSADLSPQTITFTQKEIVVLTIGSTSAVSYIGGRVCIPVEYNTDFMVEVEESARGWLEYAQTRAVSSGEMVLFADRNTGEERTARVTVRDTGGDIAPIELSIVQERSPECEIRRTLMEFYNALDGPHWTSKRNWGTEEPLEDWDNVGFIPKTGELKLVFYSVELKGEIPECIGDLPNLIYFVIDNSPGLSGTLPQSFRKLNKLQVLQIQKTGMTSLPDVFGDMKDLNEVAIVSNFRMAGPLPESLGSADKYAYLHVMNTCLTGQPPASWARHYEYLDINSNMLSGTIPHEYLEGTHDEVAQKLHAILFQQEGYGFDISDMDIPGRWPLGTVENLDGTTFKFEDIVSKNDYTVYLSWAPWCPNSKTLMPRLVDYYKKYHGDGLEIIATVMNRQDGFTWDDPEAQKAAIRENGYGEWYNFYFKPYSYMRYASFTPWAEVYDRNGNIVFSCSRYFGEDRLNRYSYSAAPDLIPFLETRLGPEEDPDTYSSTDYSKDGEVITLQHATVGNGINIVFMGDAYTDRDMDSGGLYEMMMNKSMQQFFSIEPYKTFRNRFNVYAVKAVSKNGRTGPGYTTAFGSVAASNSISTGDIDKIYEYALKVPGIKDTKNIVVGVLVNSLFDGGITVMDESLQSSVAFYGSCDNNPGAFGIVLRHEAGGHGFAFLDDEYGHYKEDIPQSHIDNRTEMYQKYGWYSNVDFTDDPAKVKWSVFLSDERYKDEVGIFEGGSLYAKGAYRPSENSMMRDNYEYFNAPSRWAIYKRIMELSGEEASFQKFLEYDAVNRGN